LLLLLRLLLEELLSRDLDFDFFFRDFERFLRLEEALLFDLLLDFAFFAFFFDGSFLRDLLRDFDFL